MNKDRFEQLMYEDKAWYLFDEIRKLKIVRDNTWNRMKMLEDKLLEYYHPRTNPELKSDISTASVTIPYQEYMRLVRKGGL